MGRTRSMKDGYWVVVYWESTDSLTFGPVTGYSKFYPHTDTLADFCK